MIDCVYPILCAFVTLITHTNIALQLGDKHKITTPANWRKGDDVIIHPMVSDAEAEDLFPAHVKHLVRPSAYLALDKTMS